MATHISRRRCYISLRPPLVALRPWQAAHLLNDQSSSERYQPSAGPQLPDDRPGEPGQDYTPVVTPNGGRCRARSSTA